MIISGAESFLLPGGNNGVLLIHGFTGNPAEMLLIGQYLNSKNFTVHAVRLAGHGTNEKDLSRMKKDDWINSVIDGYSILNGCCDKIFVVGHSMGGLLALNLAAIPSIKITKIVTLAAPIFIDESRNLQFLPPRENSINKYVRKAKRHLINIPAAANLTYRLMPLISIHELIDLIENTKKNLKNIRAPIMILQGVDDHTSKLESAEYIFKNVSSDSKELKFIEGAGHLLPLIEPYRMEVFNLTANFLLVDK